ncbi:hypothetical protein DFH07DRAFT_782498 [Mycena maculata]|uniref:Uncharacterized protein n=1 Tax=Mycena maculata TaxID=230809 RepID=A0AAD7HSN4_9AGAR|nr:hypothetical protein DFH07DRAFT_782498 [Mycena maculata]
MDPTHEYCVTAAPRPDVRMRVLTKFYRPTVFSPTERACCCASPTLTQATLHGSKCMLWARRTHSGVRRSSCLGTGGDEGPRAACVCVGEERHATLVDAPRSLLDALAQNMAQVTALADIFEDENTALEVHVASLQWEFNVSNPKFTHRTTTSLHTSLAALCTRHAATIATLEANVASLTQQLCPVRRGGCGWRWMSWAACLYVRRWDEEGRCGDGKGGGGSSGPGRAPLRGNTGGAVAAGGRAPWQGYHECRENCFLCSPAVVFPLFTSPTRIHDDGARELWHMIANPFQNGRRVNRLLISAEDFSALQCLQDAKMSLQFDVLNLWFSLTKFRVREWAQADPCVLRSDSMVIPFVWGTCTGADVSILFGLQRIGLMQLAVEIEFHADESSFTFQQSSVGAALFGKVRAFKGTARLRQYLHFLRVRPLISINLYLGSVVMVL